MLLPFVMALTLTTMAHCDAVGRGHPSHQQSHLHREDAGMAFVRQGMDEVKGAKLLGRRSANMMRFLEQVPRRVGHEISL